MKKFLLLFLCACLYAADAPLYLLYPNAPVHKAVEAVDNGNADGTIATVAPADGAVVPLLSEKHKAFLNLMPREKRIELFADKAFRQDLAQAGCHPLVVDLVWTAKIPSAQDAELFISENADLSNAVAVTVPANRAKKNADGFRCQLELNNLKVATAYYWKVRIGNAESPVATFTTEDKAPRLIRIYRIGNIRDLGGYIGLDGRRLRQGMLIRTAGLNGNATKLYATEEEAKTMFPKQMQEREQLLSNIALWEKLLEAPESVKILPVELAHDWTVFLPQTATEEEYVDFCHLTEIPESFMGMKAEKFTTDEKWSYTFPDSIPNAPALCLQYVEAAEDGYMVVGCGADWWWMLSVNGKIVCDRLTVKDNVEWPASADNHVLLVPLRKGMNLVSFAMKSGSSRWTLACGKPSTVPAVTEILEKQLAGDKAYLAEFYKRIKGYQPGEVRLTDDMRNYLVNAFHIKSDIDLRSKEAECACMTGSPLGPEVKWFSRSYSSYGGMGTQRGKDIFRRVFRIMLIPENYPIVFHCIAGQDRTGSVACTLLGLLGVSEEEIYLDWEATGFLSASVSLNHKDRFSQLIEVFDAYPGNTLNERIVNYVLDLGFTMKDINDFRELILEEK